MSLSFHILCKGYARFVQYAGMSFAIAIAIVGAFVHSFRIEWSTLARAAGFRARFSNPVETVIVSYRDVGQPLGMKAFSHWLF